MAEIKHTPGPWQAHFNAPMAAIPGHIIETADDVRRPVASLWVGGGTKGKPTQIANAHLIAAAPELLEALGDLVEHVRHFNAAARGPLHQKVRAALAAIAKAEGRSDG